jgi:hypothetical protein
MDALCLIIGFCFMSSSLELYSPTYLNAKHLLYLVGPLSVLVALGGRVRINEPNWKTKVAALAGLGFFISFIHNDIQMGAYLTGVGLFYIIASEHKFFKPVFVLLILFPVVASIYFQVHTKNYPHFKNHFNQYVLATDNQVPIITNNFVYFRREILFEDFPITPENLYKVADWSKIIEQNPKEFKVFIYKYYKHSYPDEGAFISNFETWMSNSSFKIVEEFEDDWIQTKTFRKVSQEILLHSFSPACSEDSIYIKADSEFIPWSTVSAGQ